jgi:uncharacterized membrane protein
MEEFPVIQPDETEQQDASPEIAPDERWGAAACYLGPGWLFAALRTRRTDYVLWHLRQGFALFFVEMAMIAAVIILDQTLGRIPILGFLLMILVQLACFMVALILSVLGFVKGIAGEPFRIPVLDEYAEHVPFHN